MRTAGCVDECVSADRNALRKKGQTGLPVDERSKRGCGSQSRTCPTVHRCTKVTFRSHPTPQVYHHSLAIPCQFSIAPRKVSRSIRVRKPRIAVIDGDLIGNLARAWRHRRPSTRHETTGWYRTLSTDSSSADQPLIKPETRRGDEPPRRTPAPCRAEPPREFASL